MRRLLCLGISIAGIVFAPWGAPAAVSLKHAAAEIDAILDADRKAAAIVRNPPISEEVFVRRVFLDVAGRIPTPHETLTYLQFQHPDKRAMLIETLMQRESYTSNFFNFWADILRYVSWSVHSPAGVRYAYGKHLKDALSTNKPYDRFVRELLSAKGYPWENGAVGYYERDHGMPFDNMAITTRIFLGTQMECAQCHDHPFDRWKQTDFYKIAAYTFGEGRFDPLSKQPHLAGIIGRFTASLESRDPRRVLKLPKTFKESDGKPGDVILPTPLFGPPAAVKPGEDPGEVFAQWVASPQNPRFTTVIVNRLWKKLFGVGVIRDFDDLRDSTTPMVPALEHYLEKLMVALGYDMKAFLTVLLNTQTYQSAASAVDPNPEAIHHFPGPLLRRMTAEQIWDSLVALVSHEPEAKNWVNEAEERKFHITHQFTDLLLESDHVQLRDLYLNEFKVPEWDAQAAKAQGELQVEQDAVRRGSGSAEHLAKLKEANARAQTQAGEASILFAKRALEEFRKKRGWTEDQVVIDGEMRPYAPGHSHGSQWLQRVYLPGYGDSPKTPEQTKAESEAKNRRLLEYAARIGIAPKDHAGFLKYCEKLEARSRGPWGGLIESWYRASELISPTPRGHFLRVMGQSDRTLVDNGRQDPGIPQAMLLMNSDLVSSNGLMHRFSPLMISVGKEQTMAGKMDAAYLALFSRKATPAEHALWEKANGQGLRDIQDLIYALLNTQQFIFIQ
ncbi:MAG: hypothetical protein RLZZ399_2625 [Verrucomicrobiota bacterium]|jgi:hypothetical protein